MRTVVPVLLVLLALGVLASGASADEVRLKSGEVLVGNATVEGQTLRLVRPDGTATVLPLASVDRIRHAAGYVPARGMVADGTMPPAPPAMAGVVERQGLVPVVAQTVAAPVAPAPCEEECPPDPCEDPCKWDGPWTLSLGASFTQAGGNSDSLAFKFDFELIYDQSPWRWVTKGFYAYAESGGNVDTNRVFIESKVDRDLSKRAFAFAKGSYDQDEPADLDYRVVANAGVGMFFIKECDMEFSGEAGGGVTWEKRTDLDETVDPSAYIGLDFWKEWSQGGKIVLDFDYLPNLNDYDLTLIRFDARYELPLSACLSFRMGLRLDYQIQPVDPALEKLDWIVSAGLGISF